MAASLRPRVPAQGLVVTASSSLVLTACADRDLAGIVDKHVHDDGLAAHVAILDVFLLVVGMVDQDGDPLAAIRATDGRCAEFVHT